jgi:hypothetical protein
VIANPCEVPHLGAYDTAVICIDYVRFSLYPIEEQYGFAEYLSGVLEHIEGIEEWKSGIRAGHVVDYYIPTGDGVLMILDPRFAGYSVWFALAMRNQIERHMGNHPRYHGIRTAVHHGEVCRVVLFGRDNFIGAGINDCTRLLSEKTREQAQRFYDNESLVVASRAVWREFENTYPRSRPDVVRFMEASRFRESEWFSIHDKNRQHHEVRLINSEKGFHGGAPIPDLPVPLAGK